MKLPSKLRIGAQTYKVEERPQATDGGLTDALAYTLVESNLIVLRKDLPEDRKRSLLIHESLHALVYSFNRQDRQDKNEDFDGWEHHFIGIVQEPLLMLLRDNPELVQYLTAD